MTDLSRGALILQHGADGPPGVLGQWLEARGVPMEVIDLKADGRRPPDPAEFALVASLGSECSVTDALPWIAAEQALLRRALERDVPVLGLCFGGQSLAVALGGEVSWLDKPEIGWLEIETDDPDTVPAGPWLQDHLERFSLPPGAVEIARRPTGPQAFRHGRNLGLQFHPEVTAAIVEEWIDTDPRLEERGIDREELRAAGALREQAAAENARRLLDAWLRAWANGG